MIRSNGTVLSAHGWVRSSRCTPNTNCTEVLVSEDEVGVRDSKRVDAGSLFFDHSSWTDFLRMITS